MRSCNVCEEVREKIAKPCTMINEKGRELVEENEWKMKKERDF